MLMKKANGDANGARLSSVLTGMTCVQHLKQNLSVFASAPLSDADLRTLEASVLGESSPLT